LLNLLRYFQSFKGKISTNILKIKSKFFQQSFAVYGQPVDGLTGE